LGIDEILADTYPNDVKVWLCKTDTKKMIMELYDKQA
jgi:hypothetical protein